MRRHAPLTLTLLLALLFVGVAAADALDATIAATDANTFVPNAVSIQVGETITWTNEGGFHNVVVEQPGGTTARSGDPTFDEWTFALAFDTPGSYTFFCDPHVTIGMTGTVTVLAPTALTLASLDAGATPLPRAGLAAAALTALALWHTARRRRA